MTTETVADVLQEMRMYAEMEHDWAARIQATHAREVGELQEKCAVTLGVGNGDGSLFVHGDYDSIKAVQSFIFRAEQAESLITTLKQANIAYSSDNANLLARALAAEKKASELQRKLDNERMDAARWRHARRIFAVDEIETAQEMFTAFGFEGDETENLKADAAIDAAMVK